ncbi:MAG: GreA/GreB family elongation factor [Bdellovibrionia bacterium]
MTSIDKRQVIELAISRLNGELSALVQAAKAAHEAATHEESRAEDKHDTRGLEASYLAGAQAARATELQKLIMMFRQLQVRDFAPDEPVAIGAIVEIELESNQKRSIHLLTPLGGGIAVSVGGVTVQVITPQAPLGEALLGKKAGDIIEIEAAQGQIREYSVIRIF